MAKKTREHEKYLVNMTQNAENDLNEIIMFIAQNNPQNAMKIMERHAKVTVTRILWCTLLAGYATCGAA